MYVACKCNPGYQGPDGGQCAQCPGGQYKSWVGSACSACRTGCGAGQYRSSPCTTLQDITCKSCPSGKTSEPGANTVVNVCRCSAGTYGPDGDGQGCSPCAPNTYRNFVDPSPSCIDCPLNSQTQGSAQGSKTDCKCNAGFEGEDGGPCTQCPPGKYKTVAGSGKCVDCSIECGAGRYRSRKCSSDADIECTGCPKDTSSNAGAIDIKDCWCVAGTYGPHGGECTTCARSSYRIFENSNVCVSCQENAQTREGGSKLKTDCTCNPGYFGPDGGPCQPCKANTYKSIQGSTSENNIECTSCPSGPGWQSLSDEGSDAKEDCKCPPGRVGTDGADKCTACEKGKYKQTRGHGTCIECGESSSTRSGDSKLKSDCICNTGYYGPDGGEACEACAKGTFKPNVGSGPCTLCPPGKHSSASALSDSARCKECGSNTFSSPDRTVCASCPDQSSSEPGAQNLSMCLCNPGYTFDADSKTCVGCKIGTYKASFGSMSCQNCPSHETTMGERSVTLTQCICDKGYARPTFANPCVACQPGKYKDDIVSSDCKFCKSSKHSVSAATSETQCTCNAGYEASGKD